MNNLAYLCVLTSLIFGFGYAAEKPKPGASNLSNSQVESILNQNCKSCHEGPKAEVKMPVNDLKNLAKFSGPNGYSVLDALKAGDMPPKDAPTKLNEADRKILIDYFSSVAH